MRLLHLADTHLGVENYGRLDAETGLPSRLLDFLAALDRAVDHAISNGMDAVLFAGDAYKTRDPNPTHQRELAKRIRRLCVAGIPCFLLVGNHDLPSSQNRAHSTEIFDTLAVEDVTVARTIGTWLLNTRSGPLQVVSLPWVTHSTLLTRDERKGCGIEQLNSMLLRKIAPVLEEQFSALDPALPAVLVGHATVEGAAFGSERAGLMGWDLVLPQSLLAHPSLQYAALGHLHRHQVVGDHPPMVYSGSLERVDFGEEGEEKGFVEVELKAGSPAQWRFVPVPARRFVTVEVHVEEGDPTAAVLEAIASRDLTGAIVRVILRGATSVRLREAEVRQALASASYVSAITQETERTNRSRLLRDAGESLTPEKALDSYLKVMEVGEERRRVLLTYARGLLAVTGAEGGGSQ